jgi:hypothetical protein
MIAWRSFVPLAKSRGYPEKRITIETHELFDFERSWQDLHLSSDLTH